MKEFTPKGRPRQILIFIEEEGAQFTETLAKLHKITRHDLRSTLLPLLDRDILGRTFRTHLGRRSSLYHLGPKAKECLERIRASEASA